MPYPVAAVRGRVQQISAPASAYQREVTIDNTGNASTLTNYQVRVEVVHSANMRSDFNDIRFYSDSGGSTALDHWREYYFEYERAAFWVEVASITGSASMTIYMRYGQGETATANSVTNTFGIGEDFEDGATAGVNISTAASAVAAIPAWTALHGVFPHRTGKYGGNPVLGLGTGGAWDDVYVRELCPVVDENGHMVEEGDGIWAYYGGYDGAAWQIGLAKSTDGGFTWTKYGSNPVLSGSGVGGSWYEVDVLQPSVVKTAAGTRYMAAGGDDTIGLLSSADGLTWSDEGAIVTLADYDGGNLVQAAVPSMIKRVDGTWVLLFEGDPTGATSWRIYGQTASNPTGTWTALNSGNPIFTVGSGGAWDDYAVANPHVVEVSSGNYLMVYNGRKSTTDWQVGFASSTDLTTWTRSTHNPVLGWSPDSADWDDGPTETSYLVKESSGHLRMYYQGFDSLAGNSKAIGLALIPQGKVLNAKSTATSDGWVIWNDLDSYTTFVWEALAQDTGDASISAQIEIGLFDYSTNPAPTTSTSWNPLRRFLIFRYSATYTPAEDKFAIGYIDTGGTLNYWTGSAWGAITYFGGEGIYKLRITDDGTNYTADILDWVTGQSVLANVASIAKSSVKAFGNGRVVLAAQGYTNAHYMGQDFDNWLVRAYTTPEPTTSVGSESPIA